MKKLSSYLLTALTAAFLGVLSSCSDYEPKGYPDVPELAKASGVEASVAGRTVTLNWQLPAQAGITGVRVSRDNAAPTILPADATSCTLKGQPMDRDLIYTIKIDYEGGYVSEGTSVIVRVPYVASKMAYLMTAPSVADLPDDDERAAATWFAAQENAEFIQPSQIASLDPDIYSVIWIEIDRFGLPVGWENLPGGLADDATIAALREYSAKGGSLYLSNMATQLTVPLEMVPENMAPTIFGNGYGGTGTDVWVINPYLGVDFKDGGDQGYYDRTAHEIYKGLTLEDPNNYGYLTLPLIGPGMREDHNCMWDLNAYNEKYTAEGPNTVVKFEKQHNAVVLGTWGHVQDYAVAGVVEFLPQADKAGRIIANGLAACEWSPRTGVNVHHDNLTKLTANCIEYLTPENAGVESVEATEASDAPAEYFNLQGMAVAADALTPGIYVVRNGAKTSKVIVK